MSRRGAFSYAQTEKHPLLLVAVGFSCLVALRACAVVWLHSLTRRWLDIESELLESDFAAEDDSGTSRPAGAVRSFSDSKAALEERSRSGAHARAAHPRQPESM